MATAWTDLGGGIHVRQSRAFLMNSVALLDREHTVLVDPGVLPSELDDLAAKVAAAQPRAVTLVFTHAHWDHVLGRAWWPNAATLAHDRFAQDMERTMGFVHAEADKIATEHGERWAKPFERFLPKERVAGLRFVKLGGWRLVLRDAFGHSHSQMSVHLPEPRVLIAADMLSDIEIPILNRPPDAYLETLRTLLPVAEGAIETLIPGHGAIARGAEAVAKRFRRDLTYLDALDRRVREAVAAGVPLERAQRDLLDMPDVERDPQFPMRDIHLKNVAVAYQGVAAGAAPGH
ncbi:MAG TPA: MBL fold metallo-hydrolase [Candidatus Saccharimonadaceae bacterium]|jgi:glyoxylase-like metal-dependent hydrolase (beta-lactamase superfamily II)|nr:MBL fold metallo-hydrolase [Candidatus Saccharimonadaceae bacterium]